MIAKRIWFNKTFSNVSSWIQLLRDNPNGQKFHIICSHTQERFSGFQFSDEAFVEDSSLEENAYLNFCLDFCQKNKVDIFVPNREIILISKHKNLFTNIGVKLLLSTTSDNLELINNKKLLYNSLDSNIVLIPDFKVINNYESFKFAYSELRKKHNTLCLKPSVGVFARGFKIIRENSNKLENLLNGSFYSIDLQDLEMIFENNENFEELLLMEYLEDYEYSVDCLGFKGKLLRSIARRKPYLKGEYGQYLEFNPQIQAIADRITEFFELEGVYNIQLKCQKDKIKLLEINTRMSGGLNMSALSGINFVYWAIKNLIDNNSNINSIPQPITDIWVNEVGQAVSLKAF